MRMKNAAQVGAIDDDDDDEGSYHIVPERCIGCGLCIRTCPTESIGLVHKNTETDWFK